jgi:uncharacterized protein (DUF983 family)
MKVTRIQLLARGLTNRCPNCGARTLFKAGTMLRMNDRCPVCAFQFEGVGGREGFYLRSTSINFGVTVTCFLFPVLLLAFEQKISVPTAEGLAIAGAFVVPVLFYRSSRSWALLNYYIFAPEELPANRAEEGAIAGSQPDLDGGRSMEDTTSAR